MWQVGYRKEIETRHRGFDDRLDDSVPSREVTNSTGKTNTQEFWTDEQSPGASRIQRPRRYGVALGARGPSRAVPSGRRERGSKKSKPPRKLKSRPHRIRKRRTQSAAHDSAIERARGPIRSHRPAKSAGTFVALPRGPRCISACGKPRKACSKSAADPRT